MTAKLFSKWPYHFAFPPVMNEHFNCSLLACCSVVLFFFEPFTVVCYATEVLICISLMSNEVIFSHICHAYLLFGELSFQIFCPVKKLDNFIIKLF